MKQITTTLACLLLIGATVAIAQQSINKISKVTNVESSYPYWSPDSRQIVFQSNRTGGNSDIYIMDSDGTNINRLTNSMGDDLTPVWSPDGIKIAFQSFRDGNEELYIMNSDGSMEQNISQSPIAEMHAKWHPNSQKLIFSASTGYWNVVDHWQINIDGSGLERITRSVNIDTYPEWSPDGTKIIARRIVDVNSEIFIFNSDGTNPINLTNNPAYDGWPSWHPNGDKIVYASENAEGHGSIYELNLDDKESSLLFAEPGSWTKPIWNKEGNKLICTRTLDDNVDIFIYNPEHENREDQLTKISNIKNSYPSFSPDGSHIVFHSNRFSDNDIYTLKVDGTNLKRLTDSPGDDRTPSWSPDGTKIAFVSTRGGNYDVFVMNVDGSRQENLTMLSDSKEIHPYWSADGKEIIFNSSRINNTYAIYSILTDGSNIVSIEKNSGENTHAKWSPDGERIIFRKLIEEENWKSDIFIMDKEGNHEIRLTRQKGNNQFPSWSPDGSKIIFSSSHYETGDSDLYLMDTDGSNITRITPVEDGTSYYTPSFSSDGSMIVCTKAKGGNEDIMIIHLNKEYK